MPVKDKLVSLLVSNYPQLARRLAGRLGSIDRANEALNDTYVRLHRANAEMTEPRDLDSYLYRMAMNSARNRARSDALHLSAIEVEALLDLPDDAPDPLRVAEGRSDLEAVRRAIDGLPERRGAIFRRVWDEGASYAEVADEFGIAERTARHEMMLAVRALHEATEKNSVTALQKRLAQVSSQ